tara:strand:+ start:364 stop:720 length:357 start_codon:yes stop_codon:yes gene_type:complete
MVAVYVGRLYAVQFEGADQEEVRPRVLGVDPELGIVTAPSRAALARGDYDDPPESSGLYVARLWYRRARTDHPGGDLWYHDLTACEGFPSPKKTGPPAVTLRGPDVAICDQAGSFLCG